MNKTQKTLVSIGGASVVAALVLGYLAWDASSATAEAEETLEGTRITVSNLSSIKLSREKGAPAVTPCAEAVRLLKENAKRYEAWCAESRELASAGDVLFESTTPPAFKAQMVEDAKRLSECHGGIEGKLVARDFSFGFSEFITGGKLPAQADLPQLQREWHDVVAVVDVLAEAGATSVDEITVLRAKPEEPAPQATKYRKGKKQQEAPAEPTSVTTVLAVTFHATPECLVSTLNAFATNETFIVAEEFSFGHENDELGTKLGGSKAAEDVSKSGRKRRVRGAVAMVEEKKPAETPSGEFKGGVLTNPQDPGDFKVTMKVSVHDFLTAGKKAAAAKSAAAGESEAETEEEE